MVLKKVLKNTVSTEGLSEIIRFRDHNQNL